MDEHLLRYQKDTTYCVLDVETECLNLNLESNFFWQAGLLQGKGDAIVNSKSYFLKWDRPLNVSVGAAKVTHFDPYKVEKESRPEKEVFDMAYEQFKSCDWLIGSNVLGFDAYLLRHWHKRHKADFSYFLPKLIDIHCLMKGVKLQIPYKQGDDLLEYQYRMLHTVKKGLKTNLTALGKEFQINFDPESLHNAENDIILTFQIWNKCKWLVEL